MKACALLSGGKDSNYALYRAIKDGLEVACIVSIVPERPDSWMFHRPLVEVARLQAEAMGYADRHYFIRVSGVKEKEVNELTESLRPLRARTGFEFLVIGGIASRYQLERFKSVAESLGVKLYDPQWGARPEAYLRLLLNEKIIYIITQITTQGLPQSLLGVPINRPELVDEILGLSSKYGFHPAFEGGEAETLVISAPHYREGICIWGRRVRLAEFQYILEVNRFELCSEPTAVVDGVKYPAASQS